MAEEPEPEPQLVRHLPVSPTAALQLPPPPPPLSLAPCFARFALVLRAHGAQGAAARVPLTTQARAVARRQENIEWLSFFSRGTIMFTSLLAVGVAHRVSKSWLQESMLFILFGGFISTGILLYEGGDSDISDRIYVKYFAFEPDVFFYLLLPPIILDAAYNIPAKSNFFYNFSAILCFAFIGTLISTMIIGTGMWSLSLLVLSRGGEEAESMGYERVTWAFKLGSMLSATDPVATLSVLSSFGALRDPHLHNMIFGESILNDAVAIVLFEEFDRAAKLADAAGGGGEGMGAEGWLLVLQGIGTFCWVTAASLALGAVIGMLSAIVTRWWWITGVIHAEILVCIVLPYMAYVVAEAIEVSGIMSLFVCGMIMSHYTRYNITPQAEAVTTHGFHALAFVAEAAVFTLLGADFLLSEFEQTAWDGRAVLAAIPLCLIARACSIFPISAVINCRRASKHERAIPWKSQVVLWFAGLRGAIAYGLAKRWDAEPDSPTNTVTTVMAVVIFTTFVLGSTVASLIRCLGLDGAPDPEIANSAEGSEAKGVDTSVAIDNSVGRRGSEPFVDAAASAALEAEGGLDERDLLNGRGRRRSVPTTPRMAPRKSDFGLMAWFRRMDAEVVTPVLGGKRSNPPTSKPFCGMCERSGSSRRQSNSGQSGQLGAGLLGSGSITGSE